MKVLYAAAWILIIGFLVWSGNLLLQIQSAGSRTAQLHELSLHLDSLAQAWRDLNRPGNDVLENYEVSKHRTAFDRYLQQFTSLYGGMQQRLQGESGLSQRIHALQPLQEKLSGLAREILDLAGERERLRLDGADSRRVQEKETAAAAAMARMDQVFQDGLQQILEASSVVVRQERGLEDLQRQNFRRLYIMLLVTLLASALSLELIRRVMRQREALRDAATRINTIMDNVVDGIVTVDPNGAIQSMNQSAELMFGYREAEVNGMEFSMLLERGCRRTYLQQARAGSGDHVMQSLLSEDCDGLGQRRNGSTFPIELDISHVTVNGRQLSIHIVRDVSERRQADQRQKLATSVFENASEGIMVTDAEGVIQSVNPAYLAITQYTADELLGQNPRILQSGRQDAGFYRDMWSAISGGGHWQGEIWNRRKDGEIFPQWMTINAIKDARGRITNYVGVAVDISGLKASQRMKEEFLTTISHELRTPLTSVLGSLGMLRDSMTERLPEQARKLVELAHGNSQRLVRLISDILDIEKIEAGKMTFNFEPLDLAALVNSVVEDCKVLAGQAEVNIASRLLAGDSLISGDADRLMQALTNLLANAIRFSSPGQTVEVELDDSGEMLQVTVTDHGPGIPEEFQRHVFKRFTQAGRHDRGRKAGTGLGLSIARLIVLQHGGRIDFRSIPGEATTFIIELPRAVQGSPGRQPEDGDGSFALQIRPRHS